MGRCVQFLNFVIKVRGFRVGKTIHTLIDVFNLSIYSVRKTIKKGLTENRKSLNLLGSGDRI
jgi:hypothetical protein